MVGELMITSEDRQRIQQRIREVRSSWRTYAPMLDWFRADLDRRQILAPVEVPGDVITMNSRFDLMDQRTGDTTRYTLVYPEDEAPEHGRVSVLSPMGMALLGAQVGDVVYWNDDNGPGAARVVRMVYQPEAAGDHHL